MPIGYVYDGEKRYFHNARAGDKLDAIQWEPKAFFCAIDRDQILPEEHAAYFRSIIAFGTMRIL